MKLRHPFEWLPMVEQTRAFVLLFVLTIVVMFVLQVLGGPLITDAAPSGIVSFELAGTLARAQRMVESWGPVGRIYAGLNLGLDFLFLVAYPLCIGLGCVMVARAFSARLAFLSPVGVVLAWGQWLAGLLDAIENCALIQLLLGSQNASLPVVAQGCAIPKFLIVGLGILYVLLGALAVRVVRH